MKKSSLLAWFAFLACLVWVGEAGAQTQRKAFKYKGGNFIKQRKLLLESGVSWRISPFDTRNGDFIAISIVWYSQNWNDEKDKMDVILNSGSPNSKRVIMHQDGHMEGKQGKYVSELYFYKLDIKSFGVNHFGYASIDSLEIHFFDPGPSQPPSVPNPQSAIQNPQSYSPKSACTCPQPPFQGRLGWCPDGSCPTDPTPEFVPDPTHVIIHHTAGTNVASDWAAVVRSIWDFHVNTNGWDDIGYNWLVDPNGVLYEGRGDGRLGAHFCGQNGKTTGICIMGDFTNIEPTTAALETLADFLAWETCDENIDPLGTSVHSGSGLTLMNVSGHRDGCSTSCPGDKFYPLLPTVRQAAQDDIDTGCDVETITAPTVLAITFVGHNKINLQWLDNSTTETGFVIERSDNVDNSFNPIIQLPANTTTFSDTGVSPNNTYFYRVRAKQGSAFSDYSNVAVAITAVSSAASQLHGGSLAISPNPTDGQVFLSIDNQWFGNTAVAVFDGLGRMVTPAFYEVKQHEKQLMKLDLGQLPAGLYWMKLTQGVETTAIKIVKQ